jgi:hypothetical protein
MGTEQHQEQAVAHEAIGNTGATVGSLNTLDTRWAMASDDQWNVSRATWESLLRSGVLPKHVRSPEAAMTLAEAGRVHGWSPMQSVRLLCLIEGTVSMTVNGMWMLILAQVRIEPGSRVRIVERSMERAAIEVVRPLTCGDEPVEYDFTQEDAVRAKLWGKTHSKGDSPWVLFPRAMLLARCKSIVARDAFGDVVFGVYTDEEMISSTFREASDSLVTDILTRKAAEARPTTLDDVAERATKAAAGA